MYITFIVIAILLVFADGFTVRGPPGPLVVPLGSSVVLPCYVDKPLPVEDLEVEWKRTDSETLVNLFLNGEIRAEVQQQEYQDRAHFFTDQIQHGNFSLRLDNLTAEDQGKYTCKVYSQQDSGETEIQIQDVERLLVSGSSRSMSVSVGEDVTLNCSVDSHIKPEHIEEVSWKRTDEDILVLLYQNNETSPDSSDEQYRDRVEFFTDEIPKGNFSLRLKSVRTEDKGVYMCEVFAGVLSANTTVVLEQLGFSSWHNAVLGFCIAAASGAVLLLFCLIYCRSKNTVNSRTIWILQLSLVFLPNVCMFFAFILWGFTEGFLHETITCCALYFLRPVMLIWALSYLKYLQDNIKTWIRFFTITSEFTVFTVVVYSVFFTYGWRKSADDTDIRRRVASGIVFGGVVLFCLILSGGDFIRRSSLERPRAASSRKQTEGLRRWITSLRIIVILLDVVIVTYIHPATLERKKEYLGWICVFVFMEVLKMIAVIEYNMTDEERSGIQRRQQTEMSQQGSNILHLCNFIMYMSGAVGLVLLNSVTLTAELILKAQNGERVLKDLRVIVFPSECVFALYWLILLMYAYYLHTIKGRHLRDTAVNSGTQQRLMKWRICQRLILRFHRHSDRDTDSSTFLLHSMLSPTVKEEFLWSKKQLK